MPMRIYWDSCVFIDCLQKTAGRIDALRQILAQAGDGKIRIVTSELTRAEVVKGPDGVADAEAENAIEAFFDNEYFSFRNVDRMISSEARHIARKFGLKPPDAIHVATAIRFGVASLQTFDGLDGHARKLLAFNGRIGNPSLKIEVPVPAKLDSQTTMPLSDGP